MPKQEMQANGEDGRSAAAPDGVNNQADRGAAGESDFSGRHADYPHGRLPSNEGGEGGFMGHGGQSHLTDRSNSGKQVDETDSD